MSETNGHKTITIKDVGNIPLLELTIPQEGGVVILRGASGTGKSTALRALDAMSAGRTADAKLTPRDGTGKGSVKGMGVTMSVAKSVRRTGEAECTSLEGRLSVAALVDPGLKGEDEADARRIRALVQLAGVEPDPILFHGLVPGGAEEFNRLMDAEVLESDDILVLADRVKRKFEEHARGFEGRLATEISRAEACKEAASGIAVDVESDSGKLQAEFEAAVQHRQGLAAAEKAHLDAIEANEKAVKAFNAAKDEYGGLDVPDAFLRAAKAKQALATANEAVAAIRMQLTEAQAKADKALADHEAAEAQLKTARAHEATIAECEKALSATSTIPERPTADQFTAAQQRVDFARKAVENGESARMAKSKLAEAERHMAEAAKIAEGAEAMRKAAAGVDQVLSDQIATLGCPLFVRNGRLMTTTHRGDTLFGQLSDGERWKLALDVAIDAVGPSGMLVIPQPAWEGCQPANQKLIHEHCRKRGVVLVAAQVTDDPQLTAEVLS